MSISRRELLKQIGLTGAAIVALPELSRVLLFRRNLEVGPVLLDRPIVDAQTATLTAVELATLEAFCARLIPTDDNGPGAAEAHAARYIDRALGGALASSRQDYARGLAAIDTQAHQMSGDSFVKLTPAEQDQVLTSGQNTPFFQLVRGHTLQGTFCDPIYGGNANMVGWDLIGYPGVRLNVTAAEQNMSTPAARNHKSAYDYLMFSKTGI